MSRQPGLFDQRYPDVPGWKKQETSKLAADSMRPGARNLRELVLDILKIKPSTADEAAHMMGLSVLSIRPRFTELVAKHKIVDTGQRRENESGRMAIVWRLA